MKLNKKNFRKNIFTIHLPKRIIDRVIELLPELPSCQVIKPFNGSVLSYTSSDR